MTLHDSIMLAVGILNKEVLTGNVQTAHNVLRQALINYADQPILRDVEIREIFLANGFNEKVQPDGSTALNPYVFTAGRALARHVADNTLRP